MISTPLLILIGVGLYFGIGIVAWRAAERRGLDSDTKLLIYGWLPVAVVVAVDVWSVIAAMDGVDDEPHDDDRAQLTTPRWLPMLLVGLAVVATILHHLGVV